MKFKQTIMMAAGAVLILAGSITGVAAATATPPNIVLILVDDQGWNGLSCKMDPDVPGSRSDFYQTPNIDRLANEGMRFSRGYSAAPICSPSRHSIQFGISPAKMRVTNNRAPDKQHCNPQNALPNLIKQAESRYTAAHFGKWHVLVEPEACGYDESDGMTDNYEGSHGGNMDDPKRTFEVTDRAVSFMERKAEAKQPFFLQVSYYADHKSFMSSPAMQAKYEALPSGERHTDPVFAGMNEDLDQGVGRILDTIDRLGIAGNTYIVYTADNGYDEDRPTLSTPPRRKAWPLSQSKGWLYEGGVRVPFIVRGPGVKPNSYSMVPVLGYDLMPTFLELIKPEFKLPDVVEGGSLLPVLEHGGMGEVKRANDFIQFQAIGGWLIDMSSYIVGSDKLVYTFEGKRRRVELFDLDSDISEQNDLSMKFPEKTQRLNKEMLDYLKSVDAFIPSDEEIKKARGMGRKEKNVKSAKKKTPGNYLTLQAPKQVAAGTTATVTITHEIPPRLGEQQIHVAVRSGKGKIKQHEFTVKGSGTLDVSFDIPKHHSGKIIRFNAYLGETYQESLQFLRSEPVLLK